MPRRQTPTCLVQGCKAVAYSRGLCLKHYQAAKAQLEKQGGTWEQLVEKGLALDKGAQRRDPFRSQVEEALSGDETQTTGAAE